MSHLAARIRKAKSSEKAETMPAAIITAIVTSMILLAIAGILSYVFQSKSDGEEKVALATVASNIDVSLRADISQGSYLTATAKLKQPESRLLTENDLLLTGVNVHLPEANSDCKVIRWSVNGTTVNRDLTVYKNAINTDRPARCDETSEIVAKRNKVFADNIIVQAPFAFHNQLGNPLRFTLEESALTKVNDKLEVQLEAKGVEKLDDDDFNKLNRNLDSSSFIVAFADPAACVMNAEKVSGVCPEPEAATILDAWNSKKITKVSVMFIMQDNDGGIVSRNVEQNSSNSVFADTGDAEAEPAVIP